MSTELQSTLTSRGSILTTELDALANGSRTAASSALANGTNKDRFGVAELTVDFVSAPTDYATCDLYGIPAYDGTNYADGSNSVRPSEEHYLASFQMLATASPQRLMTRPFELISCNMKFILVNKSGQAFPASGSIVKLYTFNREI